LARGSTWSLNRIMTSVSTADPHNAGASSRPIDTPLALNAVISFSDASRLKA
jgi:hypothetical protein